MYSIHFSLLSGFTVGKCTCFFPLLAKSGAGSVAQMRRVSFEFCEKVILFVIVAKICNGKIKGLAIQYIFHCFFENSSEICIQYIFHCFFENSSEICIQYIFHYCFENSRGKCIEPHARYKCHM